MITDVSSHSPMLDRAVTNSEHRAPRPYDYVLLLATFLLMGLGVVMVYSSSAAIADSRMKDPTFFLTRHLIYLGGAIGSLIVGMSVCYKRYQQYVYWLLGGSILLMMLVLVPGVGVTIGRSTRWFRVLWFTFQPSELVKITFIMYLSYSLAKKSAEKIKTFSIGFLPHVLVCGIIVFLCLFQPDFGTSLILALMLFSLLFIAGTKISYLVLAFFVAIPFVIRAITSSSMRYNRVLAFLDPWAMRWTHGFQTVASLTAVGSGGWTGLGLGNGRQKLGHIPTPQTDFIFPIVGEELGFIGVIFVVGLFVVILWRGMQIAYRCKDEFGRYLAFGLTMLVSAQALIHMGVAMNLLPTKGLTLPFVSFGGSSLMLSAFTVGVLLNISKYNENPIPSDLLTLIKQKDKKIRRARKSRVTKKTENKGKGK